MEYTQEKVDALLAKEKESNEKKINNNYVDKNSYDNLQNEYQALQLKLQKNEFKEFFLKNGGNESCYDDFYAVNGKDFQNATDFSKNTLIAELKNKKPYFFNSGETNINKQAVLNGMKGDANGNTIETDYEAELRETLKVIDEHTMLPKDKMWKDKFFFGNDWKKQ